MQELEFDDIQAFVLRGFGSKTEAAHLVLLISDAEKARACLGQWLDAGRIIRGEQSPDVEPCAVMAFTLAGLMTLQPGGIDEDGFSRQFREGLTAEHRSRILGDVGENAPEKWRWGGPNTEPIHAMMILLGKTTESLDKVIRELEPKRCGFQILYTMQTHLAKEKEQQTEPFGFRDGLSQPIIQGSWFDRQLQDETLRRLHVVAPGEFILGYKDDRDQLPQSPWVAHVNDPHHILPTYPGRNLLKDFGRNGSYLVVREMAQHTEAFWAYMKAKAPDAPDVLASRFVGRKMDGTPLISSGGENGFTYSQDPQGLECPLGAHIRRSNPRDSTHQDPDQALATTKRHRLLRRGRHYYRNDQYTGHEDERGLVFACFNSDLERQFEFVQYTWCNNPFFAGLQTETDPIVGTPFESGGCFTIPQKPLRQRVEGIPPFVAIKGGAYFFVPGLRALRFLCTPKAS